jgi:AcrR family transcriptional regulator
VRGRPSGHAGRSTEERLKRAALASFAQRGFEGASTHEIARRAKANQALIRHHFGGKDPLWRQVVAAGLAELCASVEQGRPRAESSPMQAVTIRSLVAALAQHAELLAVIGHALLEPGARRDWLLAEQLGPLRPRALRWLADHRGREPDAQSADAFLWMWMAAAAALPCFGAVLASSRQRAIEPGTLEKVQSEVLEQWLLGQPLPVSAGPWSLPAAARRRLDRARGG